MKRIQNSIKQSTEEFQGVRMERGWVHKPDSRIREGAIQGPQAETSPFRGCELRVPVFKRSCYKIGLKLSLLH